MATSSAKKNTQEWLTNWNVTQEFVSYVPGILFFFTNDCIRGFNWIVGIEIDANTALRALGPHKQGTDTLSLFFAVEQTDE